MEIKQTKDECDLVRDMVLCLHEQGYTVNDIKVLMHIGLTEKGIESIIDGSWDEEED